MLIEWVSNKVLVSVAQWFLPISFLLVIHVVVVLRDVGENHLMVRMDQMSQDFGNWDTSTSSMLAHWVRILCMKVPRSASMFA